ncbi:Transmembrane 9 superfamily member 3 [Trichinella murrelli]|uniref:Transmembrane 9 superfamily member n=1 Tax=Trichinella murrelli TaxID=144512 RepID=A0A0V0U144_9BILA|nr:Transmembrane 9 superfamily member 3 [Trichinella murrelli]
MTLINNSCHFRRLIPENRKIQKNSTSYFYCLNKVIVKQAFLLKIMANELKLILATEADEHSHTLAVLYICLVLVTYKDGEEVVLWMNTVGPYHNLQETYPYFSLPFCRGSKLAIAHYHETISDNLLGVDLEFSGLDIKFKVDVPKTAYCTLTLLNEEVDAFHHAIRNHYWFQMYIDDLPLWGIVGEYRNDENSGESMKLFTHRLFEIGYNGNTVVEVNLTSNNRIDLKPDVAFDLTYEVMWKPSTVRFHDRFDKYLDANFFKHRIHWFSLFNSFMMVIFLVTVVTFILMRTLRKDYARYEKDLKMDDFDRDFGDEYGWKQIHGDVFRSPSFPMLFSCLIGSGIHVFVLVIVVILITFWGELYLERGSILTATIFCYALFSPVSGYVGGCIYTHFGGKRWIKQALCCGSFLPLLVATAATIGNISALYQSSTRSIPFGTMASIVAIYALVVLPLTLIGSVVGRNMSSRPNNPCRVNAVPRPIPEKKIYLQPWLIIIGGGLLPFGSIFIEVYFIFTSFWAYKVYYVYGFMFLVTILLAAVTMCMTIVCTYVLLNSEDYRWRWTSFLSGASISLYLYLYSIYYFIYKTRMYGFFQTTFYFVYSGLFCIFVGLMCGAIGYVATANFMEIVRKPTLDYYSLIVLTNQSIVAYCKRFVANFSSDYTFPFSFFKDLQQTCSLQPQNVWNVLFLAVVLTGLRFMFVRFICRPLAKYWRLTAEISGKLPESLWNLTMYLFLWLNTCWTLVRTDRWKYFTDPLSIWSDFSRDRLIPYEVDVVYLTQTAFYVHATYGTIFMEQWRKDSKVMVFHHLLAITLLSFSWAARYDQVGILVLFLHDVSDVFLECAKIFKFIFRLYWFPLKVLYTSFYGSVFLGPDDLPFIPVFNFMLWLLFFINIYWFHFILMLIYNLATGKFKELEDSRELENCNSEKHD